MKDEPVEFTQTFDLYMAGDYAKAYDLITSICDKYPAWQGRAYEIRFNLAAMMGNLEQAETILEQSLDLGFFYNEFVLRYDEDIKVLHGRKHYENLVERSFKMLKEAQQKARPKLKIIEPLDVETSKLPLLVGLHGNNSHSEGFSDYWDSLTQKGWLVALPQSAEVAAKGLYVWNDIPRFEHDLPLHYQKLNEKYSVDEKRILVAGFSKGGHAAIHIAIKGLIPVSGFIAFAPYVGNVENWQPLLEMNENKKLRGYFVLGGRDEHCTPGALALKEQLITSGVNCAFEIFPEMQHDIPESVDEVLQRALGFILNN